MRKAMFRPMRVLLFCVILLVGVLSGCGGGDDNKDASTPAPVAATPESIAAEVTVPASGTQVVFVTPVPTQTPTITPTFDFPIDDYSGVWGLEINLDVTGEKPIPDIEQWSYDLQVALTVDQYGIISGEGTLQPTHDSRICTIEVDSYDPFLFRVEGNVRDDPDNNIFFDLTIVPINPAIAESYTLSCNFGENVRIASFQYVWPVLFSGNQLSYSFPIQGRTSPDQTFVIDAPAVTAGQFSGLVLGSAFFFRQQ